MGDQVFSFDAKTSQGTWEEKDCEKRHYGLAVASVSERSTSPILHSPAGTVKPSMMNYSLKPKVLANMGLSSPIYAKREWEHPPQPDLFRCTVSPSRAWNGTSSGFKFPTRQWPSTDQTSIYDPAACPDNIDSRSSCRSYSLAEEEPYNVHINGTTDDNVQPQTLQQSTLTGKESYTSQLNPPVLSSYSSVIRNGTSGRAPLYPSFSNLSPIDSEFNREVVFTPAPLRSMAASSNLQEPIQHDKVSRAGSPAQPVVGKRIILSSSLTPTSSHHPMDRETLQPPAPIIQMANRQVWNRPAVYSRELNSRKSSKSECSGDTDVDTDEEEDGDAQEENYGPNWTHYTITSQANSLGIMTDEFKLARQANTRRDIYSSTSCTIDQNSTCRGQSPISTSTYHRGHSSTESLEKRFMCPYAKCGRAFARNYNLQSHIRSHLGIRDFDCPECEKKFSRKHDCMRHRIAIHQYERGNNSRSD